MRLDTAIKTLGQPFHYYPSLAIKLGISANTCLLYCFVAWKTLPETDGWVALSADQIRTATGLTENEQRTSRGVLVNRGLIEEKYVRIDHQMFFKVTAFEIEEEAPVKNRVRELLPEQAVVKNGGDLARKPEEAVVKNGLRHIQNKSITNEQNKDDVLNALAVSSFLTKWDGYYRQQFGRKYLLKASDSREAALLLSNAAEEELFRIAREAWKKQTVEGYFWCKFAVTIKGYFDKFNEIRNELETSGKKDPRHSSSIEPPQKIGMSYKGGNL